MGVRLPPDIRTFYSNSATATAIYTLSLHDALPISTSTAPCDSATALRACFQLAGFPIRMADAIVSGSSRSEEHTSELQSHSDLVCRLLLEKKKDQREGELRVHAQRSCRGQH